MSNDHNNHSEDNCDTCGEEACEKYTGPNRRSPQPWHLDKTLNISHLITTLTIAGSLFMWGAKMDTRVAVLESQGATQQEVSRNQDTATKELRKEISVSFAQVNEKLDKLVWEKRGH